MLQTGMFLLKVLQNAAEGKTLSDLGKYQNILPFFIYDLVSYLAPIQQGFDVNNATAPTAMSSKDFFNLDFLLVLIFGISV